ncbi:hypothetical protein Sste5344_008318 [Sporothrix stenoceras]
MPFYRRKITVADDTVTSAVNLTTRQSLLPNFLSTLNISSSMSAGLSSTYFGAYFICPPTISGWILRRFGFRVIFMTGLAVLVVGCLLFWPSGVKRSFGGFCGSMVVVGAGLSTLETTADPFLSICGPPRYSEIRLNLAQAIQDGLKNVQWVYLGVAGFVALLAVLFFLAPMPEITDADINFLESETGKSENGPLRKQYNLFYAVSSQFCYVGAQVAVANYFITFFEEAGRDSTTSSDLLAIGQGLYAFNRFVAGFLLMIPTVKPRYILTLYLGLCVIFIIAAITTTGTASIAILILALCFESACFATIFTLGLRGLGCHTKVGGSLLVTAISGGMAFPAMTGAVIDRRDAHIAMTIPMMGYVLAFAYPVYVNVFKRDLMDSHRSTDVGVIQQNDK